MIRSLFAVILFMTLQMNAFAEDACLTIETTAPSLQDILSVVEKVDPRVKMCQYQQICNAYTFNSADMSFEDVGKSCEYLSQTAFTQNTTKECGMSYEEFTALQEYTGSAYGCMNSYLRQSNKKNQAIEEYIQLVNQALDKLPNYQGIVVRGGNLPSNVAEMHQKGNIVTYQAFTSTSTGRSFSAKDQFLIISKTGKPIMGSSQMKAEHEVLFKSGTRFEVLETFKEGTVQYYVMKEVTDKESSEAENKADLALVEKMKQNKTSDGADYWSCPEPGEAVVKVVEQKLLPKFSSQNESNTVMANSYMTSSYNLYPEQIDGVWNKCEMINMEKVCKPFDDKAGPGLGDKNNWYTQVGEKYHQCIWDKTGIECQEQKTYILETADDGTYQKCTMDLGYGTPTQKECAKFDLNKAPGKFDQSAYFVASPNGLSAKTCTWSGKIYECKDNTSSYSSVTSWKQISQGQVQECKMEGLVTKCAEVTFKDDEMIFDLDEKAWKKCAYNDGELKCKGLE